MLMSTILLVEDEITLLETLAYNLKKEGYEVLTAEDGEEALALIRGEQPDLVVLDVMLPTLDGLTVCRRVRKDKSIAHTPIIMLTARGTEADKIDGLESGADDYIVKPFGLGEFLARVRAVLRRAPAQTPDGTRAGAEQLVSADLRLDLTARRAFRGEEELQLTFREFDLLAELMRNQDIVLSRDLILNRVWGYDYYGDRRTVDVHVRWLREKIETDASDPSRIVTVRGVGYRFEG
jgi:DNA-binding response OmpR family regulator